MQGKSASIKADDEFKWTDVDSNVVEKSSVLNVATFAGDDVSYYAIDIENSMALLIDGELLFIYRCDYTIYDTVLLR